MPESSNRTWIKVAVVGSGAALLSLIIWQLFFFNPYRHMTFNQTVAYALILSQCVAEAAKIEPSLLDGSMEDLLDEAQQRNWDKGIIEQQSRNFTPSLQRVTINGRNFILVTLFDLRDFATKPFAVAEIDITDPKPHHGKDLWT